MINKIIWQTHNFTQNELPYHFRLCMKTWELLNPGWEYRYVDYKDREKFVKEKYNNLYDLYKDLKPIYQSDLWRVLVVYEFGGVYVDMDSVCIKPLDYMLETCNSEILITEENKMGLRINNAMFAAPQNCYVLKEIIDLIELQYETKGNFPIQVDIHSIFSKQASKNNNSYFNAALHGQNFKSRFSDQMIDYYGKKMQYSDYLKNILGLSRQEINDLTRNKRF
jgi:mannosyltransferase OCH1-like enzyme